MQVPYTTSTGVKIGSRYQENGIISVIDDPDMLYLQTALLATPQQIKENKLERIGLYVIVLCILILLVTIFLVGL